MKYEPYTFQVDAIKWLLGHKYAGLFLPPGLGKTGITLQTIEILKQKKVIDFAIIILGIVLVITTQRVPKTDPEI